MHMVVGDFFYSVHTLLAWIAPAEIKPPNIVGIFPMFYQQSCKITTARMNILNSRSGIFV